MKFEIDAWPCVLQHKTRPLATCVRHGWGVFYTAVYTYGGDTKPRYTQYTRTGTTVPKIFREPDASRAIAPRGVRLPHNCGYVVLALRRNQSDKIF